jgi:uncharacterized membrane protein YdjX (TVP38/TMEM64 family)
MAAPPLRTRTGLRIERGHKGERDDEERTLFDGDEQVAMGWVACVAPPPEAFVFEHGHIHADVEHLLLQDQVRVGPEGIEVTSTLRLEGHPLHSLAEHLHKGGRPGRAANRGINLFVKQAHEVVDIFEEPQGRAAFAHAIRHPHLLTPKMQRSLLFLVLLSSIWTWIVGLTVLAVAAPGLAEAWNLVFTLYFSSLLTNLFVPIPVEPIAIGAALVIGSVAACVAAGLGKMVGAWIIFILGRSLRKAMANLEAKSQTMRRVLAAAEGFGRRYGYVALGLMLAVPFSPFDIIPVYLFSTMELKPGPFLLAVFVGFTLRMLMVVLAGEFVADVLG